MTTDMDVDDLPGWDDLVMAGAVAPPPPEVVERARQVVAAEARDEELDVRVVGASRRRRLLPVAVLAAAAAAAAAVTVALLTADDDGPTVVLAAGDSAAPGIAADGDLDCHTGMARVAAPADSVATLGYLSTDPVYELTELLVREERWNCPAYAPSLGLVDVAADGVVDRYVTVYGPMLTAPWADPDDYSVPPEGYSIPIESTLVQGHAAQLLDHSNPLWGTSYQAIWTDAEGRGWTANTGGLDEAELERTLAALVLADDGARVAGPDLFGMAATAYPSVTPVQHWQPIWRFYYRTSSDATVSVDTTTEGSQEGTAPFQVGSTDQRRIVVRGGKTAWLTVSDLSQTDVGSASATLSWQESSGVWISVSMQPYADADGEAELLDFVEALAPVLSDDPRLRIAQ